MEYIIAYFEILWNLTVDMAPYLLLGFLVAGVLKVYFPPQAMTKYMGRNNFRSVLNSALLGVPLPLCSCGVIPTGVSLYRNGASKGSAVSFLISTPQTGVDSILITYAMLGLPFAILRPLIALLTGLIGGMLTNRVELASGNLYSNYTPAPLPEGNKLVNMLRFAFVDFLQDIMKWLLIGLLIAAGISLLLPPEFFETFLGNGFLAMLVVLAVALPMYVCATASVPIAAALLAKGIDPGAVLVFLMAGPATNAATITVLSNVLGKKVFAVYLATIVGSAFLFGTVVNELLPREWFALPGGMAAHHHVHNAWWASLAAVVLIGLIMNGFYVRYFKKQVKTVAMENTITLKVAGMECKHCVGNVETNLINLAGIDKVVADLRTETVTVTGSNIDLAEVEKMVNSLGYKYGGVELSFNM